VVGKKRFFFPTSSTKATISLLKKKILFLHVTILLHKFVLQVPLTLGLVIPYFFSVCVTGL
jgi:hypothetical protein